MFLQHKLSRVFFSSIVSILLVLLLVIYWYSVPLINKEIYETERNSSRLILNNVFELANKMHLSLKAYRQEAVAGHKRNLVSVLDLAAAYIENTLADAEDNQLSRLDALNKAFEGLRNFTYGNEDYIWVADPQSIILSHPDPRFHGIDASSLKDRNGELVIPGVIQKVLSRGEGFYTYPWRRLGDEGVVEKLSYVKYFPQWNILIGSGVYLDDIEQEVKLRRAQVINELRQSIEDIVIAKTGYLFIFDRQGNMLVHPNPNIDETNALSLKDPVTDQSILQELIDVADTGNELVYKWDRPTDPNNYIHDKLSLVRHLEGFGWYICSSVYVDELQSSAKLLSRRILTIGLIALFFAIVLAFVFANRITRPITALAAAAQRVSQGDLTVTSGITRTDELGVLGNAFDGMVSQLRESIETLDLKVDSRTEALAKTNQQLQRAMTQSQQAQQQLTQAQRMNAVGQLAGGLAHDFNNILTIILGNLTVAQDRFSDNNELLKRLAPAIRASRRGSDITNRLLAFSRRQSLSPCRVSFAELIDETVELLKGSLPSTITVRSDFSRRDLQAYVDPGQLENCLINLVLNAKDAMPDGGRIALNITEKMVTDYLCFDEVVKPGNYVDITVLDNGSGFSCDAIKKAFEPFFTTKSTGQGAGLGLSMVFGFIKQSQGYIKTENRQNGGARISLLLPLIEYQSDMSRTFPRSQPDECNDFSNKLILLVEDNCDVRAVVCEQLVSFGFNVIEALDSDEAEQLIDTVGGLYGMVSDISMPGAKNGFELAALLKKRLPASKIVLMSGYAYEDNKISDCNPSPTLLRKPFAASELLKALIAQNNN